MHIIFVISESIPVGGSCSHNKQCTGSKHAATCQNSRCTCSNGYTLIGFECKRGLFLTVHIKEMVYSFLSSFKNAKSFHWQQIIVMYEHGSPYFLSEV